MASANAVKLGAAVSCFQGDLIEAVALRSMSMVVSNPPYIPLKEKDGLQREVREHEPHVALFGGQDGYDIYRRLIAQAAVVLDSRGWLLMELAFNGSEVVEGLLRESGIWNEIEIIWDLAGYGRVAAARLAI